MPLNSMSYLDNFLRGINYINEGFCTLAEGIASILGYQEDQLTIERTRYNTEDILRGHEKDRDALASDWKRVGDSMRAAIGQFKKDNPDISDRL